MAGYMKFDRNWWDTETGNALHGLGSACYFAAVFIMNCPQSHQSGLFKFTPADMAGRMPPHNPEDGDSYDEGNPPTMTLREANETLQRLVDAEIVKYDRARRTIYIPRVAETQYGPLLAAGDKRLKDLREHLSKFEKSPFLREFLDAHGKDYLLTETGKDVEVAARNSVDDDPFEVIADGSQGDRKVIRDGSRGDRGVIDSQFDNKNENQNQIEIKNRTCSSCSSTGSSSLGFGGFLLNESELADVRPESSEVKAVKPIPRVASVKKPTQQQTKTPPAAVESFPATKDSLELAAYLEKLRGNPGSNLANDARILAPILNTCDLATAKKVLASVKADPKTYWWDEILRSPVTTVARKFADFRVTYNALKAKSEPEFNPQRDYAGRTDMTKQRAKFRAQRLGITLEEAAVLIANDDAEADAEKKGK